jgi:Fe-S-cluster containining protein
MLDEQINVHFAFPDGALAYDCAACDQRCCKTGSLVVFPAERASLVQAHPALELVGPPTTASIAAYATPASGCWFLDGARCQLLGSPNRRDNTAHGDRRPVACTLFPFNLFGQLGETLVVAPNGLCPLEVRRSEGIRHADVLDTLKQVGAAGEPPLPLRPEAPRELVILERLILDAATASLEEPSPVPLIAFSHLATETFTRRGVDGLEALDVSGLSDAIEGAYEQLERFAAIVGVPPPADATLEAVAPLLAAWTPVVRLFGMSRVPLERLPDAMLALTLYLSTWHALAPQRRLLPQGVMQMVSSLGSTIELLCAWDDPWQAGELPGSTAADGVPPAECIEPMLAADPVERGTQLRRLALARLGAAP